MHGDSGIPWNMGLIRVWRSQTSETLIKLVEPRILEFCLEWIHIVVVVTDGAAGMMKLGRLISCEHVVCLAHILHLMVADVFCRKLLPLVTARIHTARKMRIITTMIWQLSAPAALVIPPFLTALFRGNPTKTDVLSPTVYTLHPLRLWYKEGEPELVIISDCKTRWSSLHDMLIRYLRVVEQNSS